MPLGAARFGLSGADLGKLELIQTQEVTSPTLALDFTSIEESTYNVHFMTFTKQKPQTDARVLQIQFSTDGGSSFATSGYQYAGQSGRSTGAFFDNRSTSYAGLRLNGNQGTASNENSNGYIYFYNLGSSKYSFITFHNMSWTRTPEAEFWFGAGVQPTAQAVNAIRLTPDLSTNLDTITASLYGIKES